MGAPLDLATALRHCLVTAITVILDLSRMVALGVRSRRALVTENLFLRKQLALFQERKAKPRRADEAPRWMMARLSSMFTWVDALSVVKLDTLIPWHRKAFTYSGDGNPDPPEDQASHKMSAG